MATNDTTQSWEQELEILGIDTLSADGPDDEELEDDEIAEDEDEDEDQDDLPS